MEAMTIIRPVMADGLAEQSKILSICLKKMQGFERERRHLVV